MSSYNRRFGLVVLVLAAASLMLGGCGFRPLHGQYSAGENPGATENLSTVFVKQIPNRSGQIMRTAMERRLSPNGQKTAQYNLYIALNESLSKLAVEQNAFATRANLTLTATYTLERIQGNYRYREGTTTAVASYNILASNYATLAAEQNARERAIETLANDLRTRIAILLAAPVVDAPNGNRLP